VWFLGSWESKKSGFGVVPAKVGKSSGATFSKIQVDIYIYIYDTIVWNLKLETFKQANGDEKK